MNQEKSALAAQNVELSKAWVNIIVHSVNSFALGGIFPSALIV